jgi:hypothetical protein
MKLTSLCTAVGIGAIVLTATAVPSFSQDATSNISDDVAFSCKLSAVDRSGKEAPATVAWIVRWCLLSSRNYKNQASYSF